MESAKLYLAIAALALLSAGGVAYWAYKADDCWGRGELVKNAWGGLSCIPSAR